MVRAQFFEFYEKVTSSFGVSVFFPNLGCIRNPLLRAWANSITLEGRKARGGFPKKGGPETWIFEKRQKLTKSMSDPTVVELMLQLCLRSDS